MLLNIIKKIPHLIAPPYCEYCKEFLNERLIFCNNCFTKINPITTISIKLNSDYSIKVYAISKYDYPMKSLILAKSYSNILASKQIGKLICEYININYIEFDYLIPIPLHWIRQMKRGYNQAQIIATILSEKQNKPVANILRRSTHTPYLSSLAMDQRFERVKNIFKLKKMDNSIYKGKNLLIVDDLLTSGATITSAAKELVKLEPQSINVIVACRVS